MLCAAPGRDALASPFSVSLKDLLRAAKASSFDVIASPLDFGAALRSGTAVSLLLGGTETGWSSRISMSLPWPKLLTELSLVFNVFTPDAVLIARDSSTNPVRAAASSVSDLSPSRSLASVGPRPPINCIIIGLA